MSDLPHASNTFGSLWDDAAPKHCTHGKVSRLACDTCRTQDDLRKAEKEIKSLKGRLDEYAVAAVEHEEKSRSQDAWIARESMRVSRLEEIVSRLVTEGGPGRGNRSAR